MGKFLRKLKALLRREFPRSTMELRITVPRYRVGGLFIWDGFDELEPIDRQQRLWDVLEEVLSKEEQRSISAILTLTPEELAMARAPIVN